MELNLDFYKENNQILSESDEKILTLIEDNQNLEEVLNEDTSVQTYIHLSRVKENLLNWYEFKNTSSVLEVGSGFGELVNFLYNKFDKLTLIEENPRKATCIQKRFHNLENVSLFVGTIDNIKLQEKFDYIIVSNYFENHSLEDSLRILKTYLKENGTILFAIDNKYGIKKWNGKGGYKSLTGRAENKEFSKLEIQNLVNDVGFENSKFYYIFPDYKAPNIIFTDEHEMTLEDISRNFELNEENESNNFLENEVLSELVKSDKSKINFFVNSFLVEVSNNKILNDIKFVTYTNYRNENYQIQTIIKKDKVIKKPLNVKAVEHIRKIFDNMQYFPGKLLDTKKNEETVESNFIEGKRLDEELLEANNLENEFDKFKKLIFKNTLKYDEVDKSNLLDLFKKYSEDLLKELNYLEHAFIDMIPKNCFVIDGIEHFFDQEWMLKYIPAEYILYRAIVNTYGIDTKKLIDYYNLEKYINLFEDIENYFRDSVIDKNILLNIFNRRNENQIDKITNFENQIIHQKNIIALRDLEIKQKAEKIEFDRNTIEQRDTQIRQMDQQLIENRSKLELDERIIEEQKNNIADLQKQLVIIDNSLSWKITKPLRYVSNLLRKCCGRLKKNG